MKKNKNQRTTLMIALLISLLIIAYKVMFVVPDESMFETDMMATVKIEAMARQLESINFDAGMVDDEIFKSLKSIETPLISLPVGRKNPFSAF